MEVHEHPATRAWYKHVHDCVRCANTPFDLCVVGYRLLVAAASIAIEALHGVSGQVKTADGYVRDEAAEEEAVAQASEERREG